MCLLERLAWIASPDCAGITFPYINTLLLSDDQKITNTLVLQSNSKKQKGQESVQITLPGLHPGQRHGLGPGLQRLTQRNGHNKKASRSPYLDCALDLAWINATRRPGQESAKIASPGSCPGPCLDQHNALAAPCTVLPGSTQHNTMLRTSPGLRSGQRRLDQHNATQCLGPRLEHPIYCTLDCTLDCALDYTTWIVATRHPLQESIKIALP